MNLGHGFVNLSLMLVALGMAVEQGTSTPHDLRAEQVKLAPAKEDRMHFQRSRSSRVR